MTNIIEQYLAGLERELKMAPEARAVFLEEARAHLDERAAQLTTAGHSEIESARQAVAEFGDSQRIGASMTVVHPTPGYALRLSSGLFLTGFLFAPLAWVVVAFPAAVWYAFAQNAILPGNTDIPTNLLEATGPQTGDSVSQVLFGGWWQLILFLGIVSVVPLLWGMRAGDRAGAWQLPGIAYGLGAFLGLGWIILPTWALDAHSLPNGQHYSLMSFIVVLLFALSVGAAFVGAWWQQRRATQRTRNATTRLPAASRRRPRLQAGWILTILLLAVCGAEVATFLGVRSIVSQPGLSPIKLLAQAQQHVTFPVKQPGWIPAGMRLMSISIHPSYDFHYTGTKCLTQQWVWLDYANQNAEVVIREDYNLDPQTCAPNAGPELTSINKSFPGSEPIVVNSVTGTYFTVPTIANKGEGLQGSKFRRSNLMFQQDNVILIVSSDTLNQSDLLQIASSL